MLINIKLKFLKLFKKDTKYYDHVISLGYNCEVSFQFFKKYGFVESSLFAWSNVENIKNLINALNNFNKICNGKLENTNPMWRCCNTNTYFHGKAPMKIWNNNPSSEIIQKDRQELIERITYLKDKFLHSTNDKKNNLYIFKYPSTSDSLNQVQKNINQLFKVLDKIVKNNFDLLIILEQNFYPEITKFKNSNIYIRRVKFFTPEDDVTSKKNDKKHWNKIFSEFKPRFKLKKTKNFKFENIE